MNGDCRNCSDVRVPTVEWSDEAPSRRVYAGAGFNTGAFVTEGELARLTSDPTFEHHDALQPA